MYFITTKRMLEVCFFQHTPTFIIEPFIVGYFLAPSEPMVYPSMVVFTAIVPSV